jgi:hypothetical protein
VLISHSHVCTCCTVLHSLYFIYFNIDLMFISLISTTSTLIAQLRSTSASHSYPTTGTAALRVDRLALPSPMILLRRSVNVRLESAIFVMSRSRSPSTFPGRAFQTTKMTLLQLMRVQVTALHLATILVHKRVDILPFNVSMVTERMASQMVLEEGIDTH